MWVKTEGGAPHAIEVLVGNLLEPPDIDLRVREYDWYVVLLV